MNVERACFIIWCLGVASWIPYVFFNWQIPLGMASFPLAGIGMILAIRYKNMKLFGLHLILLLSFIPVIIYIYLLKGYVPM